MILLLRQIQKKKKEKRKIKKKHCIKCYKSKLPSVIQPLQSVYGLKFTSLHKFKKTLYPVGLSSYKRSFISIAPQIANKQRSNKTIYPIKRTLIISALF